MLKDQQDAYGQLLYAHYQGEESQEIIERDDGYIDCSGKPVSYFTTYEDWPAHYRAAMGYVQGRVLDVGCGAGRISLYLQDQGHDVLGIDNSPLALEVCRLRGLTKTSPTPLDRISSKLGMFDTILMLGNNFGLFGSPARAKHLLKNLYELTSYQGRIIAETNDIYQTQNPDHLEYHRNNQQRGRLAGQVRIRVRFKKYQTPWFDYLFVSKAEMVEILEDTGWEVSRFIDAQEGPLYIAILEKTQLT
jgi:SAM-dependent methyltransferase